MHSEPGPGTLSVPGPGRVRTWWRAEAIVAAVSVVLGVASVVTNTRAGTWSTDPGPQVLVDAAVGITCPLVGALMVTAGRLTPGARWLAHVFVGAGLASAAAAMTTALALRSGEVSELARLWSQLQSFLWVPGFLPLLTLVPLLYPDGLLPGRTPRLGAAASVAGIGLFTIGVALRPESLPGKVDVPKLVTAGGLADVLSVVGAVLLLGATVVALGSLGLRLRRSHGLARRQVVVLLGAAGLLLVVTLVQGLVPSPVDVLVQAGAVVLIPLAVGIAVTRHRLYDLDLAVCRALVLVSLGTCLACAYLSVFAVAQALSDGRSTASAAVAAGITGAVLQPLGRRLAAGVDRLYFGHRSDPFAVTSRLATRLTVAGTDVTEVPAIVCDHVVTDLRLRGARVGLGTGDAESWVASVGTVDAPGSQRFELRHRGARVGFLEVSPRLGEQKLHEHDVVVLQGVADQTAPAVAALQLHRALQLSRESLVASREAERRRLRHELHDGLGATLAGLRLQLDTARDLSRDDAVLRLLDAADAGVTYAVGEVRTLCDGLRPPGIDDLGLSRALAALADRVAGPSLRLDVDVDQSFELDPAIEVALYRIAAEALTNVVRHSHADHASLQVHAGTAVELVVYDDGVGVRADAVSAEAGSGVGLESMRQRAEEVGGTLTVRTRDGGTEVRAVLPTTLGAPA